MSSDPVAQATTDRLLACVGDVIAEAGIEGRLPTRAILIYETMNLDGDESIDYVVTKDMRTTDVIGFGHFLREAATDALLAPDDEE